MNSSNNAGRPCVFLDRDGVLNVDHGYVWRLEDLDLIPGVAASLVRLKQAGYLLVVISNQSGVGRGMYGISDVVRFNQALSQALMQAGAPAPAQYYFCPHYSGGSVPHLSRECDCRKPGPGMFRAAIRHLNVDPARSWMVGDRADDIEGARKCGIRGIQVQSPGRSAHTAAVTVVGSLAEAVPFMVS